MTFAELIGHARARDILTRAIETGRLPHALLLTGPDAVGKRALARAFAATLLCSDPATPRDACGACRECRRVAHLNHPGFAIVTRLPKKDKDSAKQVEAQVSGADLDDADLASSIVVAQIRDLVARAVRPVSEGRFQMFVVEPADRMNEEAQNALLKTLEEPPTGTVLVLSTARPHALLPTVRSRCLTLDLAPLRPERLAEELVARGLAAEEARVRAALAGGRPGAALSLDFESLDARRRALLRDLQDLAGEPRALGELAACVDRLTGASEPEWLEGLDLVQSLLRDAARVSAGMGADGLSHPDLAAELARVARALGPERSAALVGAVDEIRRRMRFHANTRLQAEHLLAAIAGGPLPGPRLDV